MSFPPLRINTITSNISINPTKIEALYSNIPDISININISEVNDLFTHTITINNFTNPSSNYDLSGFSLQQIYNDISSNSNSNFFIIDFFFDFIPISKNAFNLPVNNNVTIQNYNNLYTSHLSSTEDLFRNITSMEISMNIINNWDLSNVSNVNNMFNNNILLNQSLEDFDISNITTMVGFLDDTALSIENYNATLEGWYNQLYKQNNVVVGVKGLTYDETGKLYRSLLINEYGWTFIGDIGPEEPEQQDICVRHIPGLPLFYNSHTNIKQQSSRMRLAQRLRYNRNFR
jgi:hypothetical protein